MFTMALAFVLCAIAMQGAQVSKMPKPSIEQHIRNIIAELPPESALRQELSKGARGNGIHEPWMDKMRKEGVKRAVVQVSIQFDRHGRPKRMIVKSVELYPEYADGVPISDTEKLNKIDSSGLEQALKDLALRRAANGAWIDVPRPRPEPFYGGARLEVFDDEWLPTPSVPLYCAGRNCVSGR